MRIEAAADGSLIYNLAADEEQNIEGIGQLKGSASGSAFNITANNDGQTNIDFYNNSQDADDKMIVVTDGTIDNYSFNGNNFDVNLTDNNINSFENQSESKTNKVIINASNSNIKSDRNNDIGLNANSHDNTLELSKGTNRVIDAGDYNITKSDSEISYGTTDTSEGAVFIADGDYDYKMLLLGLNGFIKTGSGDDEITIGSVASANIINAGNGNNKLTDNGTNSFIFAGAGFDTLDMNGLNSVAELGVGNDGFINVTGENNKVYGDLATEQDKPNKDNWLQSFMNHSNAKKLIDSLWADFISKK